MVKALPEPASSLTLGFLTGHDRHLILSIIISSLQKYRVLA